MTSLFNEVVPQPDVILIMTKYSAGSKNYPSLLKFCLYKNILQWVKIGQQAKVLDMKPDTLVNPDDLSLTSRAEKTDGHSSLLHMCFVARLRL